MAKLKWFAAGHIREIIKDVKNEIPQTIQKIEVLCRFTVPLKRFIYAPCPARVPLVNNHKQKDNSEIMGTI